MNPSQIRREATTKESPVIEWDNYPDYLLLENEPKDLANWLEEQK